MSSIQKCIKSSSIKVVDFEQIFETIRYEEYKGIWGSVLRSGWRYKDQLVELLPDGFRKVSEFSAVKMIGYEVSVEHNSKWSYLRFEDESKAKEFQRRILREWELDYYVNFYEI